MSSLTLAIDDVLLKQARIKAVREGTSVNEICRKAIEQYVGHASAGARQAAMLQATFKLAKKRSSGAEPAWQGRDAVYAERLGSIGKRGRP